jgi:hypothetical protein
VKIYISGKITGKFDYKGEFDRAEIFLKEMGHVVLNPTVIPPHFTYDEHMMIDLVMVDVSDAIYMLKNWTKSKGANIEYNYAKEKNKQIIFQEDYI